MTEEEFLTQRFGAGMEAEISGKRYPITGVDWEMKQICIEIDDNDEWVPYPLVKIAQ